MGNSGLRNDRLGGRLFFNLLVFGLIGQMAWAIENVYFNTFLYNSVYGGASQEAVDSALDVMSAINLTVALSAVAAVVTTFLMGNLSDRLGRRKLFISAGYLVWGATILVFAFISPANMMKLFGLKSESQALSAAAVTVIVMDCLMTFMGSTANDSAFNAWVTDVTTEHNRGAAESILSIVPIAANVIVLGLGMFISTIGYNVFFIAVGVIVSLCGVIGFFTLKESRDGVKKTGTNYWADLFYGFRPSVIKENSKLYLCFVTVCLYSVGMQVYFPYLIIYIEKYLGLDLAKLDLAAIPVWLYPVAVAAIALAVGVIIGAGKLMDKRGKEPFMLPAVLLNAAGLLLASLGKSPVGFILLFLPGLLGYAVLCIAMNARVRDYTPEDKVGLFQGVRMIFYVLIPMIVGPTLGNIATIRANLTYVDDYGVTKPVPTNMMFVVAGVLCLLAAVPIVLLRKKPKKA
ncbi:MAG: MFS transporter [Clostridia bacterium]|nr:MFS transporter [Clostridia bacterium]